SGVVGNIGDSEAELFKKIPDVDFFDAHKLAADDHVVITLRGIGEMQGDHTGAGSRVEQDPELDEYSVPRAKVLLGTTAADNALWDAMDQAAIQLANAIAGGGPVEYLVPNSNPPQWSPNPPPSTPAAQGGVRDGLGTTHHEAGTLWMGTDPNDSVTDDLGRFHDVPNLYATGPFPLPPRCPTHPDAHRRGPGPPHRRRSSGSGHAQRRARVHHIVRRRQPERVDHGRARPVRRRGWRPGDRKRHRAAVV